MEIDRHGLLIAETGEAGEVNWVWVKAAGGVPHPIGRSDAVLALGEFDVAGAPRAAVLAWVDERLSA